jgi:hypothetical protein
MPAFFEASSPSASSRRDSAERALLHVGTPSLGRSHRVKITYPSRTATSHTHSGMFQFLLSAYPSLRRKVIGTQFDLSVPKRQSEEDKDSSDTVNGILVAKRMSLSWALASVSSNRTCSSGREITMAAQVRLSFSPAESLTCSSQCTEIERLLAGQAITVTER